MQHKKRKTNNPAQMIAQLKKQLSKTMDPHEKESLQQRIHHWYQVKNKQLD